MTRKMMVLPPGQEREKILRETSFLKKDGERGCTIKFKWLEEQPNGNETERYENEV